MICFNAYTSILAIKQPERIRNLLAYSSMVTKASADYQGTPWLAYDIHFRQVAAVTKQTDWSQVNSSLWTQYFANAKIATAQDSGLTMVPVHQPYERGTEESSNSGYRPEKQPKKDTKWKPYPKEQPICLRWNRAGCRDANCSYRHICLDCHSPKHKLSACPGKETAPNQTWQTQGWQTHAQMQPFRTPVEGPRK